MKIHLARNEKGEIRFKARRAKVGERKAIPLQWIPITLFFVYLGNLKMYNKLIAKKQRKCGVPFSNSLGN